MKDSNWKPCALLYDGRICEDQLSLPAQMKVIQAYANLSEETQDIDYILESGCDESLFSCQGFWELVEDVRNGWYNCVIVVGSRRLGLSPDWLGKCLNKLFPNEELRLISILDSYDSLLK